MTRFYRFSLLLLVLSLAATPAFAQGTSASLTGTVTSEGKPLPGVAVTVSSPSLQGTRATATGSNGGYSFPALPPGDYSVVFELEGLEAVTRTVRLILAQATRADAELAVKRVAEAVTVSERTPAAAVLETTQIATNFTGREIGKLPIARTIRATVLLAPGVSPNGVNDQITISGAPSYDNVFLVDGVVVNENLRGQPHNLFIEDAIQETTVLAGGVSAEYGRFTGGVVSTLTKSGGNRFHGSFRDSFSNPDWTEKTPWPSEADHVDHTDQIYEATFGGRIFRDRLWFFAAGRHAERSVQRFTGITNLPYTNGFDEKRYEGKLTGQIARNHSLVASYLDITNDETNNAFGTILDYNSLVPIRSLPNSLLSFNYSGVLTKNLMVEAQYARKEFAFENSGGRFTDRVNGTLIVTPQNRRFHSPTFCGVCDTEERNNDSWLGKATYYLDTPSFGSHSIALGAENFAEERIANNHQEGSDYRITSVSEIYVGTTVYPRFDSNSIINFQPILKDADGTDLQTFAIFLNDRWELDKHWSFNVGVRYDENKAKDDDGNTISDDSDVSPRLAIAWDPKGEGRQRVTATYGRYVSKIADGNVGGSAQASGNPATIQWRYRGPVINPGSSCSSTAPASCVSSADALAQLFAWFDSVGGTSNRDSNIFVGSSIPGFSARFPESIKSPSVDEITVGYGTRIGSNAYAKLDLISREWNNFYANQLDLTTGQVVDPFGNRGDVSFTVNNDSSVERKYRGVQLQAQWNPGRFNLQANYHYSRLRGNDDGEGAGTATIRNQPLESYYPEYLNYQQRKPVGWLGQDQRHRARLWASYTQPTPIGDFDIALLQSFDSGLPYSAVQSIDASGRATPIPSGNPVNPGYTLSQLTTSHDYYFSKRGEFRTDDVSSTDIALGYSITIKGLELFLRANVSNVFDEDAVILPNTDIVTRRSRAASNLVAFNPRTETPVECTQRDAADPNRCAVAGAHWLKGVNFGRPDGVRSYQPPRTYGFTAGFRF